MVPNRLEGFGEEFEKSVRSFQEKWETEPEYADLTKKGYHLVIWRHPEFGQLNGYVGIKRDHPFFGKTMNDKKVRYLRVHWGVTFSGERVGEGFKKNYWYLGFDTIHAFDYAPMYQKIVDQMKAEDHPLMQEIEKLFTNSKLVTMPTTKKMYKDIDFVSRETVQLYEQLKEAKQRNPQYNHSFVKEYRRLHKEKQKINKRKKESCETENHFRGNNRSLEEFL